jgi:hypothetical protein
MHKLVFFIFVALLSLYPLLSQSVGHDSIDYRSLVKINLPRWIEMQKSANSKIDIDKFFIKGKSSLTFFNERFIDASIYVKKNCCWNLFDVYSPDSTKIVNIHGYRYDISKKDKKIHISNAEPDAAIEFILINKNKYRQYGFTGTAGEYDDCFWVNNSIFIVAASGEISSANYFETTFTVFDLEKNVMLTYASNVYFRKLPDYIKIRYPECEIEW